MYCSRKKIIKSAYHNDYIWTSRCHVTKPYLISMSWAKHYDITKNNSCLRRVFSSILLPWGGPCVSTIRVTLTLLYHTHNNIPSRVHLGRWHVACSVIHVYISLFLGRNTIKTGTIRYAVVDNYRNWNITVNYFWLWPSLFLGRIFHWKVLEAQNYFFNQSAEHSNVQITWLKRWCSDQIIHDRGLLTPWSNEWRKKRCFV